MCIDVLHTYVGCIKSSDTETDAEISVQEPEPKNINVLNPVDPWCVCMYIS